MENPWNIFIPQEVLQALEVLENSGYQAFVVGGCVRDSLLHIRPRDWDITTSALPHEVKALFCHNTVVETGLKHGTVTVIIGGRSLEITTYRVDGTYLDHRRPESVAFSRDIHEDLKRRDFTVNAMAYSPKTGLVDDYNGRADLEKGILRCVGDAEQRFEEDALRILRGLRFAAVYGLEIELQTAQAAVKKRGLLAGIAQERLREELVKLVCGNGVKRILLDFREILVVFLPELGPMFDFDQRNPHHYLDVWAHTVEAVSNSIPLAQVRLALLFHDIGKPTSFHLDEAGIGHFYGHPGISEEITRTILHRLRFDNSTIQTVLKLVRYHDCEIPARPKSVKRWLLKLGEEDFKLLLAVKRADRSATNYKQENVEALDQLEAVFQQVLAEGQCFSRKQLAVNGSDLIDIGIPRGKAVGLVLSELLELVIEEALPNDREALLSRAEAIRQEIQQRGL